MKNTLIAIFFLGLGGCIHQNTTAVTSKTRSSRSVAFSKKASAKAGQSFQIVIVRISELGQNPVVLRAEVMPLKDIENGQFRWKLPEGAQADLSEVSGVAAFKSGIASFFEITVDGLMPTDTIFFHAFEMREGSSYGSSSLLKMNNPSDAPGSEVRGVDDIHPHFRDTKVVH